MTLYDFLVDQLAAYGRTACDNFGNREKVNRCIGAMEACDKVIKMLSDETLKTEVIQRYEAIKG